MEDCARCGHTLVGATECPSCGTAVADPRLGWRTDTAERPRVPTSGVDETAVRSPLPPPTLLDPPPSSRYPLFADEAHPPQAAPAGALVPHQDPDPARASGSLLDFATSATISPVPEEGPRRIGAWWPWAAGVVAVLLLAVGGTMLMLAALGADPTPSGARADDKATDGPSAGPSPEQSPNEDRRATPSPGLTPSPRTRRYDDEPTEVVTSARPAVPATADPREDVEGDAVTYEATNLIDRDPTTCWRMPGDGSGNQLSFVLGDDTEITRVGLVNGYAKTAADGTDWYAADRRVLRVQWDFDDGTSLSQTLSETRALQTIPVPDARTGTVRLSLVEVSAPGTRPRRDFTAISGVSLLGRPR